MSEPGWERTRGLVPLPRGRGEGPALPGADVAVLTRLCRGSAECPLTAAAQLELSAEMIKALRNGGAHLDFRTREGMTALHKAVRCRNHAALLVSRGTLAGGSPSPLPRAPAPAPPPTLPRLLTGSCPPCAKAFLALLSGSTARCGSVALRT